MEGELIQDAVFFRALTSRFRDHLVRAVQGEQFVCVPQSCSLASSTVSLRDVEHHILTRGSSRGEFTTLSGCTVHLSGSRASTGRGFPAAVVATLLSSQTLSVALPGGAQGRLHVYFLSRPFVGGTDAPASAEELDAGALAQLVGFVRMAPDGEAPLTALGEGVARLVRAFLGPGPPHRAPTPSAAAQWLGLEPPVTVAGGGGGGGGGGDDDDASGGVLDDRAGALARSPLAAALRELTADAAAGFSACGAFDDGAGSAAAAAALQRSLVLAAEAECCARVRGPLFTLLRVGLAADLGVLRDALVRAAARSPGALGVKASFAAADLRPALNALAALTACTCPLTVLHALRDTVASVQACLEASLSARGVDLCDVDFGTDDILTMLVWLLALAARGAPGAPARAAAEELPVFLAFVHVAHVEDSGGAGALRHSALGYNLANWETVVAFLGRDDGVTSNVDVSEEGGPSNDDLLTTNAP